MVVMVQDCLYKLFPHQAEKEDLSFLLLSNCSYCNYTVDAADFLDD